VKPTVLIDEFVSAPTPPQMDRLIATFGRQDIVDEDISYLANRLCDSGEILKDGSGRPADVPSTGGPSSLSTLLCPLQLVAGGAIVPKLGIPGRPAGGIDVMACIPGFRIHLTKSDVVRCLGSCGYAHFLGGEVFVPLDAVLFEYRRKTRAIHIPALAIASLLAKKLAMGVTSVVLDVRVASFTNFGSTWEEARGNAARFIRVARMLGIDATCFLTDAAAPYQPFIGRGESLVGLHRILLGNLTGDLAAHLELCSRMSRACLSDRRGNAGVDLKTIFANHLRQQGASWDSFVNKVSDVESETSEIITAGSDGYLCVDLDGIRRSLVRHQDEMKVPGYPFSDPCGITLLVPWGTAVEKGTPVAKVRSSTNLARLVGEFRPLVFESADQPMRRAVEMVSANG
jgi:thymidine phosphorylase